MKEADSTFHALPEPVRDHEYQFDGLWLPGGVCRIRTYERPPLEPVVIATELPQNDNTSITNMAEYLAAEILDLHFADRAGLDPPLIWVEHYPERVYGRERVPEELDLVRFERTIPVDVYVGGRWRRSLGEPEWRYLRPDELKTLLAGRATSLRNE